MQIKNSGFCTRRRKTLVLYSYHMDRDKNNNPLSQPPATDTGSSQVPDTSSLAPSADTPIISSAGLPTATPLNAPLPTDPLHPTHTSASGSGDIKLETGRNSKRSIIIISIIAVVILFVALLMLLPALLKKDNEKVATLLQQNFDTIKSSEDFFEDVYYGDVVTTDIMTPEMYEQINQNITQFVKVQKNFAKIDTEKVSENIYADVAMLQESLARKAEAYQKSLDLYNKIYIAYTEEKPEMLDDYLASDEYAVMTVAERFIEYFNDRNNTLEEISANGCTLEGHNASEICVELVEDYNDTIESMEQSHAVPQAIFFAYDSETSYQDENLIMPRIEQIIKEQEG